MGRGSALHPTDPVTRLRGIGPRLEAGLGAVGIHRVLDLLLHVPRRYEDRTQTVRIVDVPAGREPILIRGVVRRLNVRRRGRRGRGLVQAEIVDASGALPVAWFNQTWLAQQLRRSPEVYLYGELRPDPRDGQPQLVNPVVEPVDRDDPAAERIVPIYGKLGPLSGRRLRRTIESALSALDDLVDPLSPDLRLSLGLPGLGETLRQLHHPNAPVSGSERQSWIESLGTLSTPAHRRLAFDELLGLAGSVTRLRSLRRQQQAPPCRSRRRLDELIRLPFELTGAQVRVARQIRDDLMRPFPMARLLQGDVGSGKTVIAAMAAVAVLQNGYQVAVMAPTELLAEQHHRSFRGLLAGTPHEPLLLTGSCGVAERRRILARLCSNAPELVIGTHALVQEGVAFERLGLVVVDEQHRFGVAQRQALVEKGEGPHLLVMTATPIPRSLALTAYGDLDLAVLDELPPGRRPVRTVVRRRSDSDRLWRFVAREVADGGRVYVVFPLIDASGGLEAESLHENLEDMERRLSGARIGVLHGRMKRSEQEGVYEAFRQGRVQVLLSTTVIEVGVDVREATVMIIESPQRFGLSQLHQLRGRVGRGARQAWCVLLVDEGMSAMATQRMQAFCSTDDGFRLAEADLRLRGPGEMAGLRQWGADGLRFASIFRDHDLLELCRSVATRLQEAGKLEETLVRLAELYPAARDVPGY
ncbi:MAG: ATP-dependent DNA helicase RecG [Acidobacteria bacterium]|nr:ATP-dependent DNA helicase RecG [Acidobacteriota bacterium]